MVDAGPAAAQLPGLPVLQGPFIAPGHLVAVNYGKGDAFSALAVAGAWTPRSNRFQVSAGLGAVDPRGGGGRVTGVGMRATVPVRTRWTGPESSLGAALFAGLGGAWRSGAGELRVPAGGAVAYRRRIGEVRAVAAYLAPYYQWSRRTGVGFTGTAGDGTGAPEPLRNDSDLVRAAIGVDALLTRRLSLSLGYDLGEGAEPGRPGPTGGIFGAGLGVSF